MSAQRRGNTRLRYRFTNLDQARAHVHEVDGRALFFVRDDKLRFLPDSPICLTFVFDEDSAPRLVHGAVACAGMEGGTWLRLADTRPLHPTIPKEARKTPRHGCDAPVQARSEHRVASGRLLDVSAGGARILGADGFAAGDCVELRLLAPDGPTFHDLSYALVVWVADGQMGVQFDRSDIVGRHAVARLLTRNEELWDSAWEGLHPPACCVGGGGVMDPEPPRLERRTG